MSDFWLMGVQEGQHVIGDAYDHVVIMFSDIVGFITMSSTMSAVEVFLMLTNLYYSFDRLVDKYGVYKVETIGDGYMIAAGQFLPLSPCDMSGLCLCKRTLDFQARCAVFQSVAE